MNRAAAPFPLNTRSLKQVSPAVRVKSENGHSKAPADVSWCESPGSDPVEFTICNKYNDILFRRFYCFHAKPDILLMRLNIPEPGLLQQIGQLLRIIQLHSVNDPGIFYRCLIVTV